jgi:ubiquinone/menaquinone biosynthesis C-methylase UbiE
MHNTADGHAATGTVGSVLHWATGYDLLVWLMTFGREARFRERILRFARLRTGEIVLDIGCGTGSLAILAKRQVGLTGTVYGIDASPEMITRADRKAKKAGVDVTFNNGAAQDLPYTDAQFDVVLSTLMLHHLSRDARAQCAREVRRVLKPGGRVLAVDFAPAAQHGGILAHLHRRAHSDLSDIVALFRDEGFSIAESGAVGLQDMQFVVAK